MILLPRVFVAIILFACAYSNLAADTLYVKQGAIAGGDGKSWATAHATLQAGLNLWFPGDEIWVARGTYVVDVTGPFVIRDSMRIYGGFKGTEVLREHRDWYRFRTILSADLLGNDGLANSPTDPRRLENLGVIIRYANETIDSSTIIDGMQFKGANGITADAHAVVIDSGSPVFRNCYFYTNISSGNGAAVTIDLAGRPRFEYCVFEYNGAINGGAVYIAGPIDSLTRGPVFSACAFSDNASAMDGGALFLAEGARCDIVSSVFNDNISGGGGGAIYAAHNATALIYNSTFADNSGGPDRGWTLEMFRADIVASIFWHVVDPPGRLIMRPNFGADTGKIYTRQCLVKGDGDYGFYTIDPDFVDPDHPTGPDGFWNTDDDGLRVKSNSICRDKGLITTYTNFTRIDAIGNPRVVENRPDIGAYEWQREGHDDYVSHMAELRTGKLVQLYRHGITDWGQKDPGPAPECYPNGVGRNLSEDGRDQTKSVGKYMKALDVPIEDSFTSPVCRCWESALYQAGRYDKKSHWASGGGAASDSLRHIDLSSIPVNGCRMIVTHDAVIVPTIGASSAEIEEGDAAILRPDGENFTWISHFTSDNWERYRVRFPDASVGVDFETPADRALQAPLNNLLYSANSIVVYNVLGATLLAMTDEAHALRSAIDDLPSGWYAVVVTDVDGTTRAVTVVR